MKLQMPGEAKRSKRRRVIHLTPGYLPSSQRFHFCVRVLDRELVSAGKERKFRSLSTRTVYFSLSAALAGIKFSHQQERTKIMLPLMERPPQ
jgi:hypothetical protein